MKEKILIYLTTCPLKKKIINSLRYVNWFSELEEEFSKLELPSNWNLQRKLWHYWNDTSEIPLCPISGEQRKWRAGRATERIDIPGMSEGYSMFSGLSSAGKHHSIVQSKLLLERHGVTNIMHIPEIIEKRKEYFIEKYGVENPSSNDEVKLKRKHTMMERHGVQHNFINWQEKMLSKHGVTNAAHIPVVAEKLCNNRYKTHKEYQLSTGEIILLQGYEPYGFDYLKTYHNENQILYQKQDMPTIWYLHDQKIKRYYCDFYIPSINTIVEIKSPYTFTLDYEVLILKLSSAKALGHNTLLLVFDQYGKLVLESDTIPLI